MQNEKTMISIVIACYRSENTIESVINELVSCLESRQEYQYEIILVNDGSPDNTWEVLKRIAEKYSRITVINFSRNFGQHNAIMAGFRETRGDYIIGLDDDGEHDPNNLFKLVDKLQEGYDYICAEYEENRSAFRGFGTKMNSLMAEILIGKPKGINLTSYYIMRRFVVEEIINYNRPFPYIAGLLLRVTSNMATVPMERRDRISGSSGYTIGKMLKLWINGFTAFSVKPLRIATGLGALTAAAGIIWAVVLILEKLFIRDFVAGYISTLVVQVLFSGIIMIILGMIGEYVGRIYMCINMSPQYVIKERICYDDKLE